MLQTATAQEERALETLILDEFGKRIYKTQNRQTVQDCFHSSHTALQAIMTHLHEGEKHTTFFSLLLDVDGDVRPALSGNRLVRFILVAQYGRCAILEHGYDPSFFVTHELLLLATQAQQRLLHACEVA